MPLKLSLKPGEKFVLNGAVLTNGDKRTSLVIQNKACVLREKDIMQVEEANTPARRIYFPIMMMYLDADTADTYYSQFALRMTEFMKAMDRYKRENRRPFPTWSEVLEVLRSLGYRRVAEPTALPGGKKDSGVTAAPGTAGKG